MASTTDPVRTARRKKVAKRWRDNENTYISQLSELLPYSESVKTCMNKVDTLRLVKTFFYTRDLENKVAGSLQAHNEADLIMQALDGFLISVDQDGLILYVSDQIYKILGLQPYRLIGNNIANYLHCDDVRSFKEELKPRKDRSTKNGNILREERGFLARLNYRIPENYNKVKHSGYVGVYFKGELKIVQSSKEQEYFHVLVAGCYIHCATPCFQLNCFDENYILRFDKNDRFAYVENCFYDRWGVKTKPIIGDHVRVVINPADMDEWNDPWALFHERGAIVVGYYILTRTGHAFQGITHDTMVYGSKGEKLFWVGVRYVYRMGKVKIKHWPVERDVLFIGHSYGLPGKQIQPIKSNLEDIADLLTPAKIDIEEEESSPPSPVECKSKELTLTEVNHVKSLLINKMNLDPEPSEGKVDISTADSLDSVEQSSGEDGISGFGVSGFETIINDVFDGLSSPAYSPLSIINLPDELSVQDEMIYPWPSVEELECNISEDSLVNDPILSVGSLLEETSDISPGSPFDDINEDILNHESNSLDSFHFNVSNNRYFQQLELPGSCFSSELVDYILKDDLSSCNELDLLDIQNERHLSSTDKLASSPTDEDVTLRDLLLQ